MILGRAGRARLLAIARGRSDEPVRLLEGPKAVRDALDLGVVRELWLRRDLEEEVAEDLRRRATLGGAGVGTGTREDFDRLADVTTPQGVLAVVRDTAVAVEEVLASGGLLVWLAGVQDPGNVGAIVRSAVAFGAGGVLVGEGSADPLGLKALRASAGLALRVRFARAAGAHIAAALAAAEIPAWALDRGGEDLFAVAGVPPRLALVVGAEGPGLPAEARAAAARTVGIPLAPGVESLNAAVAAGIALAVLGRRAGRAW